MFRLLFNRPKKRGWPRWVIPLCAAALVGGGSLWNVWAVDSKPSPKKLVEKSEWKPRYYKGRSYVSIQSVASYYGFRSLDIKGKQISMSIAEPAIEFEATLGEKRVRLNKMVFYFSYPVVSFGENAAMLSSFDVANVLDPILRPKARRDPSVLKVVVLDPGGGGVETGPTSAFGMEKNITLLVAQAIKPLLEGWGFTVVLTRDADEAIFPLERIRMANQIHEESVYISLRLASGGPASKGVETSTLPPASTPATFAPENAEVDNRFFPGNINDRESMALATTIQSHLIAASKSTDLGIKRIPTEDMRGIGMPAVVCRLGYITHPKEGENLARDDYRFSLASAIARGVKRYADFLSADLAKRREEDAKRPLTFGQPQATHLDTAAGVPGERVIIRVPIVAAPGVVVDRSKLEVQLFVLERVNNSSIDMTISNPPKIEWLSVLPDWIGSQTETFQAIYERPRMTADETEIYGRRAYYGYVARLIYDGKLLDEFADPTNLDRCLYFFTPVFPRR